MELGEELEKVKSKHIDTITEMPDWVISFYPSQKSLEDLKRKAETECGEIDENIKSSSPRGTPCLQ